MDFCGICREESCDFETRCSHHFHKTCLSQWYEKTECCPFCRSPVTCHQKLENLIKAIENVRIEVEGLGLKELTEFLKNYLIEKNKMENDLTLMVLDALKEKSWDVNTIYGEEGKTMLMYASIKGNTHVIRELVRMGANLKCCDENDYDALCHAIENSQVEAAELLIDLGANLQKKENSHMMIACRIGSVEIIKKLLENRAYMNELSTGFCMSPLHMACFSGHFEVAKMIVSKTGIDVRVENSLCPTYLNLVVAHQYKEFVEWLIGLGVDVNVRDICGYPPLSLAGASGNLVIARILLDSGANVNLKDTSPNRATPFLDSCKLGSFEMFKLLLAAGGDVKARNGEGETGLFLAVQRNDPEIVSVLLKNPDVDLNAFCHSGFTPLHAAVTLNYPQLVQMLLEAGADPDAKTSKQKASPFMVAVVSGNRRIMRIFARHLAMACFKSKYMESSDGDSEEVDDFETDYEDSDFSDYADESSSESDGYLDFDANDIILD